MTARPSLVRSIPFWILLVGSLATGVLGAWLTVDKLAVMSTALTAGTATPVDVYVGQVWAIVGGILIATGLVGLALALVVAVVRSFVPATDVEIIEALDWSAEDDAHDDVPAAESEHVAEAAPQR
ncbi:MULTISPECIES: dinucleotide-utilizing enzyme [unclassified Microbacterium]|uniref:dinucleotide-utilizing enzyme n=1 Tax=unclassified Microbacterium TaxID=2609290 RepID=UPI00214ABDCC|nr:MULTISPECIES: dinucleotide-utilizing enzyme [unclassified Microbacterium]MCR2809848.1 dinucleotide-utilizing enzyme [Microbacterium sp. zg.B185]WIM17843.1 dinucleotide-utilizing enzyme [Microbacterium sp. zg-B185]